MKIARKIAKAVVCDFGCYIIINKRWQSFRFSFVNRIIDHMIWPSIKSSKLLVKLTVIVDVRARLSNLLKGQGVCKFEI